MNNWRLEIWITCKKCRFVESVFKREYDISSYGVFGEPFNQTKNLVEVVGSTLNVKVDVEKFEFNSSNGVRSQAMKSDFKIGIHTIHSGEDIVLNFIYHNDALGI